MAKILQVNSQDIYSQDVDKFLEYIRNEEIPNPRLSLKQIVLSIIHNNKKAYLEYFKSSPQKQSIAWKSKSKHRIMIYLYHL